MTMPQAEATSVSRQISINAPASKVYKYLTDASLIAEWMGQMAVFDPVPGGDYRVVINDSTIAKGNVVELIENEKVVFTFGWEAEGNPVTPGSSTVEITLEESGGSTSVTLTHTGLPEGTAISHGEGWEHYLARLHTVAEGGYPGVDPLIASAGG